MKSYQVLRRRDSGRLKAVGRRSVPLMVPVAELVSAAREGMRDLADRMGIELSRTLTESEPVPLTKTEPARKAGFAGHRLRPRRGWRDAGRGSAGRVPGCEA